MTLVMATVEDVELAGSASNVRPVLPESVLLGHVDAVPTPCVVRVCLGLHTLTSPATINPAYDVLNAASMLLSNATAPSSMMPHVTDVVEVYTVSDVSSCLGP